MVPAACVPIGRPHSQRRRNNLSAHRTVAASSWAGAACGCSVGEWSSSSRTPSQPLFRRTLPQARGALEPAPRVHRVHDGPADTWQELPSAAAHNHHARKARCFTWLFVRSAMQQPAFWNDSPSAAAITNTGAVPVESDTRGVLQSLDIPREGLGPVVHVALVVVQNENLNLRMVLPEYGAQGLRHELQLPLGGVDAPLPDRGVLGGRDCSQRRSLRCM